MQKQDTVQPLLKSFPLYLSSVIFEWYIISDCKPRLASIWKNSPTSQANLHNGPLENLTLSFGQRVEIEHSSFCLCSGVVVVKGLAIDGQKIFFLLLKLKDNVIAWQICCSEWLWRLEDRSWSLKGFSRKRTIHTTKATQWETIWRFLPGAFWFCNSLGLRIFKAGCYRELWNGALNIHIREKTENALFSLF